MKKTAAFMALFLLLAAPASAATLYVTDRSEINVRTGPSLEYRIVKILKSGNPVDVVETTEKGWSRIALDEENTGWVLSRYLQSVQPDSVMVGSLKEKIGPLEKQVETLQSENDQLVRMNQEMAEEFAKTGNRLEAITTDYETLKTESREFLELQKTSEKLQADLEQKNQRITDLENKVTHAYLSASIKWFLAGAGVLIFGMILGGRSKRQRSGLR